MADGADHLKQLTAANQALASLDRMNGRSWKDVAARLGVELKPTRRRRRRRPSLAAVRKRAARAGLAITGERWHPDGSSSIIYGPQPDDSGDDRANPWDKVLKHDAD
jgi:hypothetical protein